MSKLQAPESFNFRNQRSGRIGIAFRARFRIATKLNKEDKAVLSSLIYATGEGAEHIFKSLEFVDSEDTDNYVTVIQNMSTSSPRTEKFSRYCTRLAQIAYRPKTFRAVYDFGKAPLKCQRLLMRWTSCNAKTESTGGTLIVWETIPETMSELQINPQTTLELPPPLSSSQPQTQQQPAQAKNEEKVDWLSNIFSGSGLTTQGTGLITRCPNNILADVERLENLIGGKEAGNNSPEIIDEEADICKRLFTGGMTDINVYQSLNNDIDDDY
ncbi:hypothetical protein CHS0354_029023 [Potamilus streckersoni]|uniref:Uncharacterized protein n=1 Tax=Potamilus streckersoni TaxID=2493646 RepID=A0AAE0SFM3_9BIVA|nr:hypothetical protein CHS0354_029023 [Potamilus streckersoni]